MIRTLQALAALLIFILLFFSCSDQPTQVDENADEFSNTKNPGTSNEAFITSDDYDELVVEVQFMPGAEPKVESLSNLKAYLEKHLEKTSVTILTPKEIPSGEQDAYTAGEVRDLEEEHRENYTEDSRLFSYAIFLDGEYSEGNVLGIAYYNTSTAYFGDTINEISGEGIGQPSREKIESTVFNHEFGHLMGLVNSETEAQDDSHHDSENGAHCTVEECLMYYQVNTTDFFANIFDGSVPELNEFCLTDIEAVK